MTSSSLSRHAPSEKGSTGTRKERKMLPLGRIRGRKFFPYTVEPERANSVDPKGANSFLLEQTPFKMGGKTV